jgi:hypothetical protein
VIQLAFDCLKFGRLAVRSAPCDAGNHYCVPAPVFEIVRLVGPGKGVSVARIEVERAEIPRLKLSSTAPEERPFDEACAATIGGKAVLARWKDETPTHFKLSATGADDRIEIVLSGDCRHRLFWWRAEFKLVNEKVVVHGPFLADDHD